MNTVTQDEENQARRTSPANWGMADPEEMPAHNYVPLLPDQGRTLNAALTKGL